MLGVFLHHPAMVLSSKNQSCIWCGRRLVHRSYSVNCEDGFGSRPGTDEHIIPRIVFGKLVTTDLCCCCKSRFGDWCDYALAENKRIVDAAQRVGLSIGDLWSRFEGVRQTAERPVKTVLKDGVFKPQSELSSLDKVVNRRDGMENPRYGSEESPCSIDHEGSSKRLESFRRANRH